MKLFLQKLNKKIIKRDICDNSLKWNLENILNPYDIDKWFQIGEKYKSELIAMHNENKIYSDLNSFKNYIYCTQQLSEILSRLYSYADSLTSLNQDNPEANILYARLSNWTDDYYDTYYNDTNEILQNEEIIKIFLEDPDLKYLKRSYETIFKSRKHTLSKNEEKTINDLSKDNSSFGALYETIVDNDLKFDAVLDAKKQTHKLTTIIDINNALENNDRILRKNAYLSLQKSYRNISHTVCNCLYYHYLNAETWAKVYKYDGYIHSCCEQDEIEIQFIEHVYEMGYLYSKIARKYYSLTKKLLKKTYGFKKIQPYDTHLPICRSHYYFSIEQAQQIVLNVCKCFGEKYVNFIKEMFQNNYIDWMPHEGKTSGAYTQSLGWDTIYSLVLINYDYSYISLSTLIHELGHAAQNYFSKLKNPFQSNMPIFCAEIASITNEILLAYYLLDLFKADEEMTLYIYKHLINETLSTTIDQIVLSKFEWNAIKSIINKQPFTVENIAKIYLDIEIDYKITKPSIYRKKDCLTKYGLTPLFISHFYSGNFYVYKYAIGQICALLIADAIYHGEKETLARYYEFLSAGKTMAPLEIIKLLDIDLSSDEPWLKAKRIINQWLFVYTTIVSKRLKR